MLDKHFDTVNHTWKHSDKCSALKVFRTQLLVINYLPSVCQAYPIGTNGWVSDGPPCIICPYCTGWAASFELYWEIPLEGESSALGFTIPFAYSFDSGLWVSSAILWIIICNEFTLQIHKRRTSVIFSWKGLPRFSKELLDTLYL